jgi:retinol-binding protein 3
MSNAHPSIQPGTVQSIIPNLIGKLKAYYVFPEIAEQICARLECYAAQGTYDNFDEGEFLALALTLHMQEVNHDQHLWVRWHEAELPDQAGSILNHPDFLEEQKQKARLDNYGIHKLERLPGNIGYIDIRQFYRTSWGSGETIVAAMSFLSNTNAVIIDLRQCIGGYPGTVSMICSYFFDEEPVHLNSLHWREDNLTVQYWTLPYIPGRHMMDQPVYILTSQETFSGGEEFAYNFQTQHRATLVGEATGGGAHPGSIYRIHPHFEVFIPNGYPVNPVTGTNWEGCGVQPDVPVPQEQALQVAYRLALKSILESLGVPVNAVLQDYLTEVQDALRKLDAALP